MRTTLVDTSLPHSRGRRRETPFRVAVPDNTDGVDQIVAIETRT